MTAVNHSSEKTFGLRPPRSKTTANKTVVDNRLLAPSRNEPCDYNHLPCCGVALPVAGATPRRSLRKTTMTPKAQTILVLSAIFAFSEGLAVFAAATGRSAWTLPVWAAVLVGGFCIGAFQKKTWARHVILLYMAGTALLLMLGGSVEASPIRYLLSGIYAVLFWALCWHKPVLRYLEVPQHKQANKSR